MKPLCPCSIVAWVKQPCLTNVGLQQRDTFWKRKIVISFGRFENLFCCFFPIICTCRLFWCQIFQKMFGGFEVWWLWIGNPCEPADLGLPWPRVALMHDQAHCPSGKWLRFFKTLSQWGWHLQNRVAPLFAQAVAYPVQITNPTTESYYHT